MGTKVLIFSRLKQATALAARVFSGVTEVNVEAFVAGQSFRVCNQSPSALARQPDRVVVGERRRLAEDEQAKTAVLRKPKIDSLHK